MCDLILNCSKILSMQWTLNDIKFLMPFPEPYITFSRTATLCKSVKL